MTSNPAISTKPALRQTAKSIRNNIDIQACSAEILQNITKMDIYKKAKNILSFYPFNNEVDLRELFKDDSKNWFLPRVNMSNKSLIINMYKHGDLLFNNKWGVPEPCCDREDVDINTIDLVILPALMADRNGHRLGYGAGFYDRFIPGLSKNCSKIIPVSDCLLTDSLPHDHWDIPANAVVTETLILLIS
jgi:5-formyltetrahydrofolate cyclo-ligase